MALQSSYTSAQGFTVPEAYSRIKTFVGSKSGIRVTVEIYYDKAARDSNKQPIAMELVQLPLENGATMDQMYTALKLDPRFAGAIDV